MVECGVPDEKVTSGGLGPDQNHEGSGTGVRVESGRRESQVLTFLSVSSVDRNQGRNYLYEDFRLVFLLETRSQDHLSETIQFCLLKGRQGP